jgi:predicted MFS family arabinose efflux permease
MALLTSAGVVQSFTFSLFIQPIADDLGWSRSLISAGYSAAALLTALCSPLMGRVLDRFGVRATLIAAVTLYAGCTALVGALPPIPWAFVALYALIGVFGAAHSPLPYAKVVSAWFDNRRGLALGVAMSGIGLGGIILPQIVRRLLETLDWRTAYAGLGGVILLIAMPAILLLIREPAPRAGEEAAHGSPPGVSPKEALRDRRFWILAAAVFLTTMTLNGLAAHAVPLLSSHGLPRAAAAAMLPALGLSSLLGRLATGYLLDRFFAPRVAAGAVLISLAGVVLLWTGQSPPLLLAGVLCLGASLGAEVDVMGYMTSRYFGLRRFGEIYGWIVAIFSLSSAAGAALMAFSFDAAGSYSPAMAGFAAALAAAAVLVLQLGPYAFAAPRRD